MWGLFRTKEQQIVHLQAKIEVLRWEVLFDLRKHDKLVPKIARMTRQLEKLGGRRLDEGGAVIDA